MWTDIRVCDFPIVVGDAIIKIAYGIMYLHYNKLATLDPINYVEFQCLSLFDKSPDVFIYIYIGDFR
jgi:hypothetical protein